MFGVRIINLATLRGERGLRETAKSFIIEKQ